jgi:hypothetical protein
MGADGSMIGVPRAILLAAVVAGALAAVTVPGEKASSFAAGLAAGGGLSFVISFLRNSRGGRAAINSEGESGSNAEDIDRGG